MEAPTRSRKLKERQYTIATRRQKTNKCRQKQYAKLNILSTRTLLKTECELMVRISCSTRLIFRATVKRTTQASSDTKDFLNVYVNKYYNY